MIGLVTRAAKTGTWFALAVSVTIVVVATAPTPAAESPGELQPLLHQYCVDCHGNDLSEARLNLEALSADTDFGESYRDWARVTQVLREQRMPPQEVGQPTESQRASLVRTITDGVNHFIRQHAGDPGPVLVRRLTSAEYAFTIQDLTQLELNLTDGFVSDAVGGEGFTNVGGAQFMQDSTLERYLEAAKIVASHAVVGAGPLFFYEHPGATGRELSAITRLQQIYRDHGFRTAAGEGAEPFGLDLYSRAMFVAWQYRFRQELERPAVSLPDLAGQEGLSIRLCEHLWSVLHQQDAAFPLSLIIARWEALPAPAEQSEVTVRSQCDQICVTLRDWQSTLAAAAGDEEEASVLTTGDIQVRSAHTFNAAINWEAGAHQAEFEVAVSTASGLPADGAVVVWRNPQLEFRREDRRRDPPQPLRTLVTPRTARRLHFGGLPTIPAIARDDFVMTGAGQIPVTIRIPQGRTSARLSVEVELSPAHDASAIVRCRISDGEVAGETAAEVGETSTLLAMPDSPAVDDWRTGVAAFARLLPEVSQREPAPSDRDPIPRPFDNTYNEAERNHFHYAIKYHRDDRFFEEHIADAATRGRLDQAWTDLLTAFDYHDENLRFVNRKFTLGLPDCGIAELKQTAIDSLPAEPRSHIQNYRNEHTAMQQALRDARPGHVSDALHIAERAWRRPLSDSEQNRLRQYYTTLRNDSDLTHEAAVRALLVRILVAPAFLYRAEPAPSGQAAIATLNNWQLASRLSYFLWSSMPDDQLAEAAAQGVLQRPEQLRRQVRRMIRDPKSRRLATEFFGQWLGFYRFDAYRGVDRDRFPEFTDTLQAAMYEEAITFFDHIIRNDRPADEILFADYTFLNDQLAQHYGIATNSLPHNDFAPFADLESEHRGGLLGLGAVLTVTSAPLRTSAVKRGDWVLRRIVGTPVPPPPADVGSIPADDLLTDGLTVRQRLEAHRRDAACAGCHSRIDPLGFALEHYDPIGRWRQTYGNGKPIDSSGTLSDGTTISGPDGLRNHLEHDKTNFHRTLCFKLLGYALGRTVLASDRPLIDALRDDCAQQQAFLTLVERIVLSDQFRKQRTDH